MKRITVRLPEATLRRLEAEARATGRTIASLVRERIERPVSIWAMTSDLAGSVAGSHRSATNGRRRFRR